MFVDDLTNEFFKTIFKSCQTNNDSVLVSDHDHVEFLGLHAAHQVRNQFVFRNNLNLTNEIGNRRSTISLTLRDNKVLHIHNANNIIHIIVVFTQHWKSTETVLYGFVKRLSDGEVAIDKHRIRTRNHNLANHGVAELND